MERSERLTLLRVTLGGTLLLAVLALIETARIVSGAGLTLQSRRVIAVFGIGILGCLLVLSLLALTWTALGDSLFRLLDRGLHILQRLGILNLALFFAAIGLFSFLLLGSYGRFFGSLSMRLFLFWPVVLGGAVFLRAAGLQRDWREILGISLVFAGMGYRAASFIPDVSTFPFSMGWSEASRYYYASLFFSRQIYGSAIPTSVLHPSRYLMQAVPFLIPNAPLWLHRLWQVLLWLGTTFLSGFLLARRLSLSDRMRRWAFIAWTFMFLLLGPVYYHLQVPFILVLWGFSRGQSPENRKYGWIFWKDLGVVLLASAWAGISRINWFPVPGMLAAVLYFLEVPVEDQPVWRYLIKPALWTALGTGLAFASEAVYVVWSGNPSGEFASSFTSDLLWYRLLPNPTYPHGVILDALLVSLPLALLALFRQKGNRGAYHPIRLAGLAAILLVLFAGGLVVSTKIGGGSNLHNLDAFLALLLVVAAYFFFEEAAAEPRSKLMTQHDSVRRNPVLLLAIALLIPLYFTITSGSPVRLPSPKITNNALATVKQYVTTAVQQGGEVLFIDQRQLVTFHYLDGVKMFPDYEKVFLMEMAMAGNPTYLGRFHDDLRNHRFALIVTEPLVIQYKGRAESFGEENDAWVRQVSTQILCYYQPQETIKNGIRVELLTPRAQAGGCP